jgi:hypothetical protein
MKKLMIVFLIMTSIVSNAQDTALVKPPVLPPYSGQEISREKIQMRDLPETVREALKLPDYAGWTVDAIYKTLMTDPMTPEAENLVVYIVELKRRHEKTAIRFDKDGKRLDDNDQ